MLLGNRPPHCRHRQVLLWTATSSHIGSHAPRLIAESKKCSPWLGIGQQTATGSAHRGQKPTAFGRFIKGLLLLETNA
jgi:hypothetical protein